MRTWLYDQFLANRRYADAAGARPFSMMSAQLEMFARREYTGPEAEASAHRSRNVAITAAAQDVEVLAGTGSFAHAAELALRVLEFDNSPATVDLLQEHAAHAGHGGMIDTLQGHVTADAASGESSRGD